MKNLVGNRWLSSSDQKTIDVISPENKQVIDKIPNSTIEDVEVIVNLAEVSQKEWGKIPLYERGKILNNFTTLVEQETDNLAKLLTKETGRPIKESLRELNNIIVGTKLFVEQAKHLYDKTIPMGSEENFENVIQIATKSPVGVVVAILPYNSPIDSFIRKVPSALIMGNSVIIKPSTKAPLTVINLVYLLVKAGVTIGAVGVINGDGKIVGNALISHKKVDLVSLSGTQSTGKEAIASSSINMTKILLNLTSNDAFIVLEDANLKEAAQEAVLSRTQNAGQIGYGSKRFFVKQSIKEQFIDYLIEEIKKLKSGYLDNEETDLGYLINERAALRVEEQIKQALSNGAKIVYGGKRSGAFLEPIILSDIDLSMGIAKDEEIMGPVFTIIVYEDVEEVIDHLENDPYKVAASIYTSDINKAFSLAYRLEVGQVSINKTYQTNSFELISGGIKQSGFGKEGITSILEKMSDIKIIALKTDIK